MPTIKFLRENGKLDEAYQIIKDYLDYDPSFVVALNDLGWVLFDYLKKELTEKSNSKFVKHLNELVTFNLLRNQKMLTENVCWQIIKFFFNQANSENKDYHSINQILYSLKQFEYDKPSEIHSVLLKSIIKLELDDLWDIIKWWNLSNLNKSDFENEQIEIKGKKRKIPSLAERTYIAISKSLLQKNDTKAISEFIKILEKVIEEHPDYIYLQYYRAKFLLLTNDKNSLQAFLPFARKKQNDFWVWQVVAEIHQSDINIQISCYCKALLCNSPDEFLIRTRQNLANLLIKSSLYTEAKTEIIKIIEVRKEHDYKIPFEVSDWIESNWYKSTETNKSNIEFYKKNKLIAEEILLQNLQKAVSVVEFKNDHKTVFLVDRENSLSTKDKNKYQIGSFVKLWIDDNEIIKHEFTTEKPNNDILKELTGSLIIKNNNKFGFVDNVFVPDYLITQHSLINKDGVNLTAVISFDKNKNQWNWKALKIKKK